MIKCKKCKQKKPLNRICFRFVDDKYLIDKCKECYKNDQIKEIKTRLIKPSKAQKVQSDGKIITKQCPKCKLVLNTSQFLLNAKICYFCQEEKLSSSNKLDRFCGICLSTQGLVFMSGAKLAPRTLCDIHHYEFSQVQERLQKYNLSFIEYRDMLIAQQGKCAICQQSKDLVIDHCHTSGNVRALLCSKCNMRLGVIENTIVEGTYIKYIEYAQQYAEKDISKLKSSF